VQEVQLQHLLLPWTVPLMCRTQLNKQA
jgi:hypothetical protein